MKEASALWARFWSKIYPLRLKPQLHITSKPRLRTASAHAVCLTHFDALPPESPTRLVHKKSGEVMRIKVGSIPACAILLIAVAGVGLDAGIAQAQDSCLKAPNGPAPPGSHWYYHTDHSTQSKCWSLKPTSQAAQPAPVQGQVQQQAQGQVREQVQEQPAPAAAAPQMAAPDSSAWPLPGQQPDAATIAWPAAPSLPTSADTGTTENAPPASPDQSAAPALLPAPQAPAAESAQPHPALPAAANPPANPAQDKPAVQSTARPAGEPVKPVTSVQSKLPPIALFAGLVVLLAMGMLLRSVVTRALGQRRGIKIARQEPHLSGAAKRTHAPVLQRSPRLVPDQTVTDHRISEVEEALRNLAQRQRRRHSVPPGSIPNISSTGARARS